jgi:hypothetical protein
VVMLVTVAVVGLVSPHRGVDTPVMLALGFPSAALRSPTVGYSKKRALKSRSMSSSSLNRAEIVSPSKESTPTSAKTVLLVKSSTASPLFSAIMERAFANFEGLFSAVTTGGICVVDAGADREACFCCTGCCFCDPFPLSIDRMTFRTRRVTP